MGTHGGLMATGWQVGDVHLQDTGQPDGVALCGCIRVKTMSHHEIKRQRITCAACLKEHAARRRQDEIPRHPLPRA